MAVEETKEPNTRVHEVMDKEDSGGGQRGMTDSHMMSLFIRAMS